MKGKVLFVDNLKKTGVIDGENGTRYEFSKEDIKNLESLEFEKILGLEVDFVVDGDRACEIYMLNKNIRGFQPIMDISIESARQNFFIGLVSRFGSSIPYLGWILHIAGFVFEILAVRAIGEIAQSNTLLKRFIIAIVVNMIAFGVTIASLFFNLADMSFSNLGSIDMFSNLGVVAFVGVFCGIISAIFWSNYYKEIRDLTDEDYFTHAFYCYAIGGITLVFLIGVLFNLIGFILEAVAWYRIKEVKQAYE